MTFCVAAKPTYVMKPTITGPQHLTVRKGNELVLECKGLAEKGINFQVMWLKLNKVVCQFFLYSLVLYLQPFISSTFS